MQYLGGKEKIGGKIATALDREVPGVPLWEPFCGGLGATRHLAKTRAGVASDTNLALMHMWSAAASGWIPPAAVSAEEYAAARGLSRSGPGWGWRDSSPLH